MSNLEKNNQIHSIAESLSMIQPSVLHSFLKNHYCRRIDPTGGFAELFDSTELTEELEHKNRLWWEHLFNFISSMPEEELKTTTSSDFENHFTNSFYKSLESEDLFTKVDLADDNQSLNIERFKTLKCISKVTFTIVGLALFAYFIHSAADIFRITPIAIALPIFTFVAIIGHFKRATVDLRFYFLLFSATWILNVNGVSLFSGIPSSSISQFLVNLIQIHNGFCLFACPFFIGHGLYDMTLRLYVKNKFPNLYTTPWVFQIFKK